MFERGLNTKFEALNHKQTELSAKQDKQGDEQYKLIEKLKNFNALQDDHGKLKILLDQQIKISRQAESRLESHIQD